MSTLLIYILFNDSYFGSEVSDFQQFLKIVVHRSSLFNFLLKNYTSYKLGSFNRPNVVDSAAKYAGRIKKYVGKIMSAE